MPVNSSFEYGFTVRSVAFSMIDKNQLYISGWKNNQEAKLLDITNVNAQEIRNFNATGNNAYSISPSPDETKFALGCNDNKVHIFNITTGKNFANFTYHSSVVNSVAWDPSGLSIASAGADGDLLLWRDSVAPVVTKVDLSPTPPINATKRNVTVTIEFNESLEISSPPTISMGLPPNYDNVTFTGTWLSRKQWHGTATVPIDVAEGQNRVKVDDVRDLSGNVLWPGHLSSKFYVDTIAPQSNASKLPQYMNKTKFNITANANDSTMGVKEVELWYRNSSGAWTLSSIDTSPQWEFEFNATGDDVYAFETRAMDFANNTEPFPTQNDTWTIVDTIPPISSVRPIAKTVNQWNVTVEANATDKNEVKLVELWYRKDGGAWKMYADDYQSPFSWDFNVSGTGVGTYELASIAVDGALNREPLPAQNDTWVRFDLGLPETKVSSLPLYSIQRKFQLDIGVQKVADGIDHFEMWANDGSGWKRDGNTTQKSYLFNASKDGLFQFYSIGIAKGGSKEVPPLKNDTFTIIDTVAPTATMTSPKDGDKEVALDSNVTITFSERMNIGSVSLTFEDAKSAVQKSVSWSGNRVLKLVPKAGLLNGTKYYVNLTDGKDPAGNKLIGYAWSFTTIGVDTLLPFVVSTYPGNGSIVAPGITYLSITFSETMAQTTESAVSMNNGATLTNPAWSVATLNFTLGGLASGRTYIVTVDASKAKDLGGNSLKGGDYAFTFTTLMPGKGGVRGTVMDEKNAPVQGANVVILKSGTKIGERTTDSQGKFEFLDLDPGAYTLRASKGGSEPTEKGVNITSGNIGSVQIVIQIGGAIANQLPDWTVWLVVGLVLVIILMVLFAMMRQRRRPEKGQEEEEKVEGKEEKGEESEGEEGPETEKGFGEEPEEKLEGVATKPDEVVRSSVPILKLKSETPNMVTVEWESYPNDDAYSIYHSTDGRVFEKIAQLKNNVSSFTHKHLAPGKTHWYRLAILYSTGNESPMSKPVKCDGKQEKEETL
jgi:WD40 repeat protein